MSLGIFTNQTVKHIVKHFKFANELGFEIVFQ